MGKRRRVKAQEGLTDDSRANFQTIPSCIQSPQVCFSFFWLNPFCCIHFLLDASKLSSTGILFIYIYI